MKQNKNKKQNKSQRGIAVLFAVLMTVILVSVATTIVSIAIRQTILSSTGRESQYAFYAANTGIECALYWDLNPPEPGEDEDPTYVFPDSQYSQEPAIGNFRCSGEIINSGDNEWDQDGDVTSFKFVISNELINRESCVRVQVSKEYDFDKSKTVTTIKSFGYNNNTCEIDSQRTVERGLELSYTS